MEKQKLYIYIIIAGLSSCQQPKSQSNNKGYTAKIDTGLNITQSDTLNKINDVNKSSMLPKNSVDSCHELLLLLVKSSSLDSSLKKLKFDVWVDEIAEGVAKLKLTTKNEETNDDAVLSWLEMDFNKKELRDITIDPDKPILLKYDSSIFKKIDKNCRVK